ncbi:MAG TPA: hypothetical protein DEQ61_11520 [Streptomyces sp.]|nr:hypothetical protein [Streptomyces sp.]
MNVRRTAAAFAASAVLSALAAPVASADTAPPSPSPSKPELPSALYGSQDPTYDGVWRQSIALLAQDTAGVTPAPKAVQWLAGQQCATGGFAPYRADPAEKCDAKTPVDSNATSAAVQALAALGGHSGAVEKAVGWLKSVQNEDGGWGYAPGGPSDTNSTSVVIGALVAAGEKPEKVTSKQEKSPYDLLQDLQLDCDADNGQRGAFAYQPDKKGGVSPNADATVAGALAGHAKGFVVEPPDENTDVQPLECGATDAEDGREPDEAASGAAAYLTDLLEKDGGHLTVLQPGADKPAPDPSNTAEAVIALAAGGHLEAAEGPLGWLERNSADWAKDNPAGLGTLVLATHATDTDPRSFGGADLVAQLNATGPKPADVDPQEQSAEKTADESDQGTVVWWLIGAGLAAGAGIGVLLSRRTKRV